MTNTVRACIIIDVRTIFKKGVMLISPAGRPKVENPKNVRLEIRLTKQENELLEECVKKTHTTKTEVINKGVRLVKKELDEN